MDLQEIKEGKTKLLIPSRDKYSSPEEAPVFYNPEMKTDRNISVEIVKKFFEDSETPLGLDALSATGARAIRYGNEAKIRTIANDFNPKAVEIIDKNIELNEGEEKVESSHRDANSLMTDGKKFDFIDIDPFGSPSPFLGNAFKSIKPRKSLLAVTATDLGALSGHYPKACFRRYGLRSKGNPWEHEIGLRNLILAVQKIGAVNKFTVVPLFCYWKRHYYRCFFEVRESKRGINRNLDKAGYIGICEDCGRREKMNLIGKINCKCECGSKLKILGPTWLDYIGDEEFMEDINIPDPFFNKIKKEIKIKELHYNTHRLSRINGGKAKKKNYYIDKLSDLGYKAQETVFTGYGFRTNAPQERVIDLSKTDN